MDEAVLPSTQPLACVRCAYDLRGLPRAGRCPECGADVALSLAYDRADLPLHLADPRWLRIVACGLVLLAAAPVVAYCTWAAQLDVLFQLLPAMSLAAVAVFLITWPEPHRRATWFRWSVRQLARACAVAALAYPLLEWRDWESWVVTGILSTWASLAGTLLLFNHLLAAVARLPGRSYVIQLRALAVVITLGAISVPAWRVLRLQSVTHAYLVSYVWGVPPLVGIGDYRLAAYALNALVGNDVAVWTESEGSVAPRVAVVCSFAAVWAAALHASLANSIWQVRRSGLA